MKKEGAQLITRDSARRVPETSLPSPLQAAELAEYTAKIALLEAARRRKEDEVEEWQHRVRLAQRSPGGHPRGLHGHGAHLCPGHCKGLQLSCRSHRKLLGPLRILCRCPPCE